MGLVDLRGVYGLEVTPQSGQGFPALFLSGLFQTPGLVLLLPPEISCQVERSLFSRRMAFSRSIQLPRKFHQP